MTSSDTQRGDVEYVVNGNASSTSYSCSQPTTFTKTNIASTTVIGLDGVVVKTLDLETFGRGFNS